MTAWAEVPLFSAAEMNATGSPTGRVMRDAADSSISAANLVNATSHRAIILAAVRRAGVVGMTSIEAAGVLPLTRQGHPQVSNRSASRLGELWESGAVAIARVRGCCVLGECHPHDKPATIHKPTAVCEIHGHPVMRDGASVWVAL